MKTGSIGLMDDVSMQAMAAHELKSPLALIRQLALQLGDEREFTEDVREMITQIVMTSERSLRLTTNLTRSTQLQTNIFPCEPLNPVQICEDVAHELTPLYRASGREIRVSRQRQAPLVIGHRDLLRRVLLNFGDNALNYAVSDGPTELCIARHSQTVQVGVRDDGPVLTQRKSMTSTVGRPQSSGLGLIIARNFAELMQGSIGATRHHNGMTFYINLMISEQMRLL